MVQVSKNLGKTIGVAGNQSTTADLIRALVKIGYRIDYLINVGPEKAHMIADYVDLTPLASELGIRVLRPVTYAMNDEKTRSIFRDAYIDVLIVIGWQRLVPPWLLNRLSIGAFGMHGSSMPLPQGRGRSPMVWSIIEGRKEFFTNLFKYDEGIDSGEIVATQRFDIYAWDTIRSLQHKNALAQLLLLTKHLPDILSGNIRYIPQRTDLKPTYYPKREPKHGVIDWREPCDQIYKLVRAVTRPYPGAFTYYRGEKIYIWQGQPFDKSLPINSPNPGEILASFEDNTFLVQAVDCPLYVTEWEAEGKWHPEEGMIFTSQENPSWRMLEEMYQGNRTNG